VMAGKALYYRGLKHCGGVSMVGLRRNIHRLEKALIMKPRRDVFARDYILETVEWYAEIVSDLQCGKRHDRSELLWAQNVLDEYFSVVSRQGVVGKAYTRFQGVEFRPAQTDQKPFFRSNAGNLPSYDQLLALSEYRRSVRWFQDKPVDRELIDKALMVARQSPTACNRMPYEFRIFDDPKVVRQVSSTPFGTDGYAENIPVICVVIGKLDSYFSARDRHAIYIDSSLAVMGFVYALESQGVSTCLINWPDFEPLERRMQNRLSLGFHERPVMLIAIGYADTDRVPRSAKKDLDGFRRYNFE